MKKVFFLMLSVATTLGLSAQEISTNMNNHTLLLGASIGVLQGTSEEIVYQNRSSRNRLSELLWDLKPLVYAGIDINYHWGKPENTWGIFADTSLKFGFPGETGILEDRDWIMPDYPEFLTHYSVHDNKTENAVLFDASVGASFQIFSRFLLKTYIAYDFMYFSWRAKGGSLLYPNSDGGHGYLKPISVIAYKQTWNIISPGVAFYGEFNRYFSGEIAFKISPLIWCNSEDNHILRDLIITDKLDIGLFIEPSLLFSFTPKDFFTLSLSVLYRNISYVRGDGVYKEKGKPARTAENILGAGYSAFDVGLTAKFRLRWPRAAARTEEG